MTKTLKKAREVDAQRARDAAARAPKLPKGTLSEADIGLTAAIVGLCNQIGEQTVVTEKMMETFGRQNQNTELTNRLLDQMLAANAKTDTLIEQQQALTQRTTEVLEAVIAVLGRVSDKLGVKHEPNGAVPTL